ncbi:MAG: nucleotidyltransferase family protein [Gammaproteobacteria bacterium]|nr:nucleotidyltransferase family protein [Gammaproteobacteria bacterium]
MNGGVIILAAGFARRFGSDKRRYRLPGGKTLLHATYSRYRAAFANVTVVVREEDQALIAELGSPDTVIAQDADLGMGHSLASGVRAKNDWDYLFVALGDMPYVSADTLTALERTLASASNGTIVVPVYRGRSGHPVGFTRAHYAELARLEGDNGARSVLAAAGKNIVKLTVDDEGVLRDLDQPVEPT